MQWHDACVGFGSYRSGHFQIARDNNIDVDSLRRDVKDGVVRYSGAVQLARYGSIVLTQET